MATDASFSVESIVRGYHVYKDIWAASVGEYLPCRRETTNLADRFAVAVMKGRTVVGHIPRKISNVCSVFIRKGGSILCFTTGSRRFSSEEVLKSLFLKVMLKIRQRLIEDVSTSDL